jgi:hypothetical protein
MGCAAWCVTPSEECRLKVFEYRVLRKMSGPKMEAITKLEKT